MEISYSEEYEEPTRINYRVQFPKNNQGDQVNLKVDMYEQNKYYPDNIRLKIPKELIPIRYDIPYLKQLSKYLKDYLSKKLGVDENGIELLPEKFFMMRHYLVPRIALVSDNLQKLKQISNVNHIIVKISELKDTKKLYNDLKLKFEMVPYTSNNWTPTQVAYQEITNKDLYILLVLVKTYNGRIKIELPGGKPEIDETLEETAHREFDEEVGGNFLYQDLGTIVLPKERQALLIWKLQKITI